MSRKRAPVRRIKEVLWLSQLGGLSERDIARSTNQKKSTVRDCKIRAGLAGLTWDEAVGLDDAEIAK